MKKKILLSLLFLNLLCINNQGNTKENPSKNLLLYSFINQGSNVEQKIKKYLFNNKRYKYELIEKGYISPDGKYMIEPVLFTKKLNQAIKNRLESHSNILADIFMHNLGASLKDLEDIPRQAYDTSLYQDQIRGQNRMAYMRMGNNSYQHGLMLGGMGTGGIERTPQGSFRRISFTFLGQNVEDNENNIASQFHIYLKSDSKEFASVLSTEKPVRKKFNQWNWQLKPGDGSYHALYPIEWHKYNNNKMPAEIIIKSFSPVIQKNYKESSYPVIIYKIKIKNKSDKAISAAVMLSFQNLAGWKPNTALNTWSSSAFEEKDRFTDLGIHVLGGSQTKDLVSKWTRDSKGNSNKMIKQDNNIYLLMDCKNKTDLNTKGQTVLAVSRNKNYKISYYTSFDTNGSGQELKSFYKNGTLSNNKQNAKANDIAGALAAKINKLAPGKEIEIPMVLSYDFPISVQGGKTYYKRYTKFFGKTGKNAIKIAKTALKSYKSWEKEILKSQKKIALNSPTLPDWYEGALLNKLNLLQSNCIGWFNYDKNAAGYTAKKEGLLLMGESNKIDYHHVETYDVRSYSFTRAMFWPKLEQNIITYYAETIPQEIKQKIYFHSASDQQIKELIQKYKSAKINNKFTKADLIKNSLYGPRKIKNSSPHDIWSPEMGQLLNTYTWQNPNYWPGLPPRGMLQALRNYYITRDKNELKKQYKAFASTLFYAQKNLDFDKDTIPDFLIAKNDKGIALWTYDNWQWSIDDGINSYTAGLWLTALAAGEKAAKITGAQNDVKKFKALLKKGKKIYNKKLWKNISQNQGYFKLGTNVEDIFSDTLHFYFDKVLRLNVFNSKKVKMHLNTIYQNNVKKFGNGYLGAVNGTKNGKIMKGEQQRESWPGSSYVLGATMIAYGMEKEGWETIYGTENLTTNQAGNFCDWAEAYTLEPGKNGIPSYGLRAKNYLRQLSISNVLYLMKYLNK